MLFELCFRDLCLQKLKNKKTKKTKKGHPLFPVEKFMGVLFFRLFFRNG